MFPENMVKANTENEFWLNIKISIQSHQGIKALILSKKYENVSFWHFGAFEI